MSRPISERITLRNATSTDHAFLVSVRRSGLRQDVVSVWGDWDERRQSRYVERLLGDDALRVVQLDGVDVGMFTAEQHPTSTHIENIVLLPDYQGFGIGTYLIRGVCSRASGQGARVTLSVLRISRAVRLYARLGFRALVETKTHLEMEWIPPSPEEMRDPEEAQQLSAGEDAPSLPAAACT